MKVGILGAGQLARMIALAGYPLGLDFVFLDPASDACASKLGELLNGEYDDSRLLADLAEVADVVTYEFENVPAEVAEFLSVRSDVHPCANALAVAQDRLVEKQFFKELGIPTVPYQDVDSFSALVQTMNTMGFPGLLKTRTQGYDGKGQHLLKSADDFKLAWSRITGAPAIVEAFVKFDREVSMIAVRSVSGELAYYPLVQNTHSKGILRVSRCLHNDPMQQQAQDYITRLMTKLDYVGVLALEFFEINGELVANEFAPRVHNSGHWTIEGSETSQFENHLRAILDWPLGSTKALGHSAMVNFIGGLPDTAALLALPNVHLHLYDKAPRTGRKVAHATVRADSAEQLNVLLAQLIRIAEEVDDS